MLSLSAEFERLLKLMQLSDEWHIVAPDPGGISRVFTIQNKPGLKVKLLFSVAEVHDINDDDDKIARIRNAIARVTHPTL